MDNSCFARMYISLHESHAYVYHLISRHVYERVLNYAWFYVASQFEPLSISNCASYWKNNHYILDACMNKAFMVGECSTLQVSMGETACC